MNALDYVALLRRRWKLMAAVVLVTVLAAFITAPKDKAARASTPGATFRATATLLTAPTAAGLNLPLTRLHITLGEVPERVAKKLNYDSSPQLLASQLVVAGDDKLGTITITATGSVGDRAAQVANAFADEIIAYLQDSEQRSQQREITNLQEQLAELTEQVRMLDRQIGNSDARSVLTAQRDALLASYQGLYQRLAQVERQGSAGPSLTLLSKATPVESAPSSFHAPRSASTRGLLGLGIGVLLAAMAAVAVDRIDTRLRTRGAVEHAFRTPVVAEVPLLRRAARRRSEVSVVAAPDSAAAEAYRTLRSVLDLLPSNPLPVPARGELELAASHPARAATSHPQVVLVTSATGRSGKTRTAVNLAASLAETGRSVVVLDADSRNPEVTRYLPLDTEVGLSDLLTQGFAGDLAMVTQESDVAGVQVAAAGRAPWLRGAMLAQMARIVTQARDLADVVVIDAPPLLGANDAADLLPHVDTVVLTAWEGRTRAEHAERASELLARAGAPVLGVVLVTPSSQPFDRRRSGRKGRTRLSFPLHAARVSRNTRRTSPSVR
jgi:Mrp family chromosome partitioning ATPase/capsular polysaccharide biosynthesis protein